MKLGRSFPVVDGRSFLEQFGGDNPPKWASAPFEGRVGPAESESLGPSRNFRLSLPIADSIPTCNTADIIDCSVMRSVLATENSQQ
jgi:hypothetical protein